ncbi:MAG: glutathione-disulfide reductase [Deltaproteobacteria bacterium]|nr:glutathione-disulfide reductase [Deltaproteobacteria bacterium]
MATYDFDLFTFGAGSGGVRASRMAASFGAKTAVAEERYLGGTCVNVGCIPKKLLVYASEFGEGFSDAAGFGWTLGHRQLDWKALIANKDREIHRLNGVYRRLLTEAGATIMEGRATLVDAHTVSINGSRYTSKYILIATGSWPVVPDVPGSNHAITSNEAFFLEKRPERVILVGGGYIAVEFAGIFHGMGSHVTLVHRGEKLLRGFDEDLRDTLGSEMRKRGIDLRLNCTVGGIEKTSNGVGVHLDSGEMVRADLIMYATGRAPHTQGLGLEKTGVVVDGEGAIVVDPYSQSSVPNIYAIGDCTNRIMLTPVAIAEGRAVAETLFNNRPMSVDYTGVPSAVFSQPNLATVGLTESEARERFGDVAVYKSTFRPLKHTLSGRDEMTFMKLVVDQSTDRVVGCHMIGADAGEIIQGLAIALKSNATKALFDATIGIHPTAAEEFVTMRAPA